MGTGVSGRYYTSHGSKFVSHGALIHSFDGRFSKDKHGNLTLKSGGHGQSALDLMDKHGIKYAISKVYPNGVRVGSIPSSRSKNRRTGNGMAWFPKNWTVKDCVRAGEHVCQLKHNRKARDGALLWGTYKGVRVGVIKTHGRVASIFPDSKYQPSPKRKKNHE